ncbi:hypothetical protein LCGC14_0975280 [marine sediment metagenome]|uniref:Uncharacterized protein n=1 Tax=marine sediment metagenome TaxID=412755 RepID=A0A0F9RGV2_9ZZZZ
MLAIAMIHEVRIVVEMIGGKEMLDYEREL